MKRYQVFAGDVFYPRGGMNDRKHETDDIKDAIDYISVSRLSKSKYKLYDLWIQVFDCRTNKLIYSSTGNLIVIDTLHEHTPTTIIT